jgi:N-acetylglutamate synthase-like GNAT family acetyltransferase
MEKYMDDYYFITDNQVILDHITDIKMLLEQTYWANERTYEVIQRSIKHSICFAILDEANNRIIAFARVVTDYSTMYYLADVIVDEAYRGKGLGKALLERIVVNEKELHNRYGMLLTSTAEKLYSRYGFKETKATCMCKE